MSFKTHQVIWTDEKVNNFWDYINNNPAFENQFFSKVLGREIISMAGKYDPLTGKVLDYGTSKGYLTKYLLERKIDVYSCDFSEETVNTNNEQFKEYSNFKGCFLIRGFPSSFESDFFDTIFFTETIEHLTDKYFRPTLEEIKRMLKPGGNLIVTTPNDENLEESMICCPECGGIFHRMQHVRKFTAGDLTTFLNSVGFKKNFCDKVDLKEFGNKSIIHKAKNVVREKVNPDYKLPHLVYIGEK